MHLFVICTSYGEAIESSLIDKSWKNSTKMMGQQFVNAQVASFKSPALRSLKVSLKKLLAWHPLPTCQRLWKNPEKNPSHFQSIIKFTNSESYCSMLPWYWFDDIILISYGVLRLISWYHHQSLRAPMGACRPHGSSKPRLEIRVASTGQCLNPARPVPRTRETRTPVDPTHRGGWLSELFAIQKLTSTNVGLNRFDPTDPMMDETNIWKQNSNLNR